MVEVNASARKVGKRLQKMFPVRGTKPGGKTYQIRSCCERDAVSRLSILGNMMWLEQPDDLPRTCAEHSYEKPMQEK